MEYKEFELKVYDFMADVLKLERTKNSPEMISSLSELLTSLKTTSSEGKT